MPIYEYSCGECGEKFEKLIRAASSTEEIRCPRCQSLQVKKALSLFGCCGAGRGMDLPASGSCEPAGG